MDFLEWAKNRVLPKALQSRSGWVQLFEHYRSTEPHLHQIEPTNACNYSCMMCPRDKEMTRTIGCMDVAVFTSIIDEVATYSAETKEKEIELFHFGESLFHPHLLEMIRYTSSAGLRPTLSINPANLTDEQLAQLLECVPYKVIISLDSLDGQRYRAIRGPRADIDRAVHNTELLLAQHRRMRSATEIVIRMIVMHSNRQEVEYFRDFWRYRGGKTEFREFFPWNKKELSALGHVRKYPPSMPCPFPWQYMVVQWNGDVVPCCRDYNGILKLGNVADASLKEIWNGEKYQEFRQKIATGRGISSLCQECLSLYGTE